MGRVVADASWVVDDGGIIVGQRLADGTVVAANVNRQYTAAQLIALAAAGGLTQYAVYVASNTGEIFDAKDSTTLVPRRDMDYSTGIDGYGNAPAFVRSIGQSTAVAAAIEAFSAAMPKDARWNTPTVGEQGVIELAQGTYTLERTLLIDLSSASTSRHGLTIRGQGSRATVLYIPPTASAANFKGGDSIWRGVNIKASDSAKLQGITVQGIGLVGYMTQDGDGSTRLSDDLRLWDFQYLAHSAFVDLQGYNRTLTALSRDQAAFSLYRCYYSRTQDLRAQNFQHSSAGVSVSNTSAPRYCGVGFRLENNNALTHVNAVATQCNIGFHLTDENGTAFLGGSIEGVYKGLLIDNGSSGNSVRGMRHEYHFLDSQHAMEKAGEIYSVLCTETTTDNDVEINSTGATPNLRSMIDLSQRQSNNLRGPRDRRVQSARNLLAGTWALSGGTLVATSTDLPPGCDRSGASREFTYDGAYNDDANQVVSNINPDCGSLTFRGWLKRVSGNGMLAPMLYANTTRFPSPSQFIDTASRWGTLLSVHLATSGHSWSSGSGGLLTLITTRPHLLQRGMRVQSGGIYGSGANQVPASTDLYIQSVTDLSITVAWTAGDPLTISSPAALVLPSDMSYWQGAPDVTADWQEFVGAIPIRWPVTALGLNGSNQPTLTFSSSSFVPPSGSVVRLSGFADERLNGWTHTVSGGDISGAVLTISSLTTAGLDTTSAAITSKDSVTDSYGWCGHTTIKMSLRCVTSAGTTMVWRLGGEQLIAGSKNLAFVTEPTPGTQTVASSATPALNCALGSVVTFTATAASAWGAPTNVPAAGEKVTIIITQDGTGGWAITWNSAYKFPTAWTNTGNTAGKISSLTFVSDGVRLIAQGANSWY